MKTFLLGAVSAVALMAAGSAFAAGGNDSNIDQIGDHNNASVDQSNGTGELSAVTQTSDSNGAQVIQYGAGDQSTISQDTDGVTTGATAFVEQLGHTGTATINQKGASFGGVYQDTGSHGETALIYQQGANTGSWFGAGASIYQDGGGETAGVFQDGNSNTALVYQASTGGWNGVSWAGELAQTPPAAAGTTFHGGGGGDQYGDSNYSFVEQDGGQSNSGWNYVGGYGFQGSFNTQNLTQYNAVNAAAYSWTIEGNHNTDSTYQTGGNGGLGPISEVERYGDDNSSNVVQNGSSTSYIDQGTTGFASGNLPGEGSYTVGASASVNQTGGNQVSTIVQNDGASASVTQVADAGADANTSTVTQTHGSQGSAATVYQAGADGVSVVTEAGASDLANVNQTSTSTAAASTVTQSGADDSATVSQGGATDSSKVNQTGGSDSASVGQGGNGDHSWVNQSGSNSTATIAQAGANDHSGVTQGGSYEVASVSQGGAGDHSWVDQSSAVFDNQATVTQASDNDHSTVVQGGSYNVATVHQ